ncbi:LOG family protein [Streptomyces sp. NPDC059680]|uniref:LOG family protein n=1 Tax=Streptomyces sp. NPDC059680 TaxID=3346904 RepID=UPI0036B383BA
MKVEWVKKDADEMPFARDLAERKARLLAESDAAVVMPGGVGTLDEGIEVPELRKYGLYDDPVVLLNTAGFHDGLILQLRRMDEQGLMPCPLESWSSSLSRPPAHTPRWRSALERMANS